MNDKIFCMSSIKVAPVQGREPLHFSITPEQISQLVDQFYDRIRDDEVLGSIFAREIEQWGPHLDKMKTFWRSVLLRTGEYKGKPVPVHQKIDGIQTDDFGRWLNLFSLTVSHVMTEEAAPLVNTAARRIATSLWLSRSSDPFASPPDWIAGHSSSSLASDMKEGN